MMFLEVNASIPVGCRTPKLLSLEATKKIMLESYTC